MQYVRGFPGSKEAKGRTLLVLVSGDGDYAGVVTQAQQEGFVGEGEAVQEAGEREAGRGREGRSRMIDELCEQFGYSRKHAIKLLNAKAGAFSLDELNELLVPLLRERPPEPTIGR